MPPAGGGGASAQPAEEAAARGETPELAALLARAVEQMRELGAARDHLAQMVAAAKPCLPSASAP